MKKLETRQMAVVSGGELPWFGVWCAATWLAFSGASNTIEERYFFNEYATYCIS